MRILVRLALTAACLATSLSVAGAKTAFLDGAYGNKEGCAYAKTGDSSDAIVFFLMNDEGITTAASHCEFKSKPKTTKTGFTIAIQCEAEGETGDKETVALNRTPKGYTVRFSDGNTWGPLPKCK